MKKIFLSLAVLALFLGACDKIEEGDYLIQREGGGGGPIGGGQDSLHVILLEEFTGVKCNNCPAANAKAKELQSIYGKDRLILLGIHAGNLAQVDDKHPKAFNTPEGTELFNFFNLFGVPVGFVNRIDYLNSDIIKSEGDWGSTISQEILRDPVATISLKEESFNAANSTLNVSGSVATLLTFSATNVKICLYLAENNIVSPQTMPDKSVDTAYVHNHVFRGSFTGTYGTTIDLSSGSNTFNESIVLPVDAVKENCEVIAFIYDGDSYEILQATSIEI
tara:strand:- start:49078 stop:49911 length:834 start_codon:yes stop_codon:yes gene_type:complete